MLTLDISRNLARNTVALRGMRNLSQQALAQRAGLPRSTVAHMESGAGNPSLHNLMALAGALGVSLEELVASPRSECTLVRAADIPVELDAHDEVMIHNLLPERVRGLEIIRLTLRPGATRVGTPHLSGTKEYLYGLDGCLSVLVAGAVYAVEIGDVLCFPGDQAHSYINRGRKAASAVSIVVPVPFQPVG